MAVEIHSRHHVQQDESVQKAKCTSVLTPLCMDSGAHDLAEADQTNGHQKLRGKVWVGQGEGCFGWMGEIDTRIQLQLGDAPS